MNRRTLLQRLPLAALAQARAAQGPAYKLPMRVEPLFPDPMQTLREVRSLYDASA